MDSYQHKPYKLSIRLLSGGLSLLVYDENDQQFSSKTILINYTDTNSDELTNVLRLHPELNINYEKVEIIADCSIYTVVPTKLLDNESSFEMLRFQYPELTEKQYKINIFDIQNREISIVYSLHQSVYAALKNLFPASEIQPHIAQLISESWHSETLISALVRKDKVDIVVVKNNTLQLANSYSYTTTEDVLYNILWVYEELKLNTKNDYLKIEGVKSNSEITNLLSKYITHTHLI